MNTPENEIKSGVKSLEQHLRDELDAAYKAHKWFVLAGFVLGVLASLVIHHL